MIEVDHQLEVRIVDRVHQLESFRCGVDDVGLLPPERLDGDRDLVAARLCRGAPPEVDELLERVLLRKPVGHTTRAAAAEHDDLDAQRLQPREDLPHVGGLQFLVDVGTGDLQGRRQKQVRRRRWNPERLQARGRGVEVGVRQPGDLRRRQLEVIEARGFGRLDVVQSRAVADPHGAAWLRDAGGHREKSKHEHDDRATAVHERFLVDEWPEADARGTGGHYAR